MRIKELNKIELLHSIKYYTDLEIYVSDKSGFKIKVMDCYKAFAYSAGNISFINKMIHQSVLNQFNNEKDNIIFKNEDYQVVYLKDNNVKELMIELVNKNTILQLIDSIDKVKNINLYIDLKKSNNILEYLKDYISQKEDVIFKMNVYITN